MKLTLLYFGALFFIGIQIAKAQNTTSDYLLRSTTGVTGSSTTITNNSKTYVIQQSVGQASVIGKFQSNDVIARQGFIQPTTISTRIIPEDTNLEARIYPNPVNNELFISFNELVKDQVTIQIFDFLGRNVFNRTMNPAQTLSINLNLLASAQYILLVNTGQKQFKANLIKH
jgi:hypothetical protein